MNDGSTIIYVVTSRKLIGYTVLKDIIRKESVSIIDELNKIGIKPVLLTGDNKNSANYIAEQLNIDEVYSEYLPEDKFKYILECQKNREDVCMIGDGINDAPSLKISSVGIAMGGIGSDIAIDSSDIVLVNDKIKELPHIFEISKRMMIKIKFNLSFSMILNFVSIILAMLGILNPVIGALVHNAGSVFVIVNSAFLLKWRKKNEQCINNSVVYGSRNISINFRIILYVKKQK